MFRKMKQALQTPVQRFADIPDYPFAPHFCAVSDSEYGSLRMHYVDEGPRHGPVVLMAHGEPSWSFGYRKVISAVSAAGYRVVAPDHIGFGKSDKLLQTSDYSYQQFVDWMVSFVRQLDLTNIVVLCQDWGGPISLRTLSQMPERYSGVVFANTLLPNCENPPQGVPDWPGAIVEDWVNLVRSMEDMPVGAIVDSVCVKSCSDQVIAAYDAPFPEPRYKAAALAFPLLIPRTPEMPGISENREAWQVLEQLDIPFVTAFSDSDPSTKPWETVFQSRLPGTVHSLCREIPAAGHFVQEDQPELLAAVVLDVLHYLETRG